MDEAGMANEFLLNFEWELFDMATASQELIDTISQPIAAFFKTRTKQEALDAALSRSISLCPLMGNRDLLDDPNLAARGFWLLMEHSELKTNIPYPKQFARSSENEMKTRFRAPLIGEHNAEIYGELGLSGDQLEELRQAGTI
jgi:crotonobetainyl-CoA:carnitine CoA-transferase CaiB-like acyl-CoA transferase